MAIEEKTAETVTKEAETTLEQNGQVTPEPVKTRVYTEAEFKEVVKQRDDLKKKTREIEETKEKERLEALQKSGNFEQLNQELSKRLTDLEAEKQDLLTKSEKYDILEKQIRNSLLEKIPEAKRKFVERFTIEELREFADLEEQAKPTKVTTGDGGRPGKGLPDISGMTVEQFKKLTPEQKNELAEVNPTVFRKLFTQSQKRY